MSALARLCVAGIAGAAMAIGFLSIDPFIAVPSLPHPGFPPDIQSLIALTTVRPSNTLYAAIAGAFAAASVSSALRGVREGPPNLVAHLLALLNPLFLYALALGPDAALGFAGVVLTARAMVALAAKRDYAATISLGLALAAAPLVSSSVLYLYPAVFLLAPFLSPWGLAPRRLLGFMTAVLAPLALASVSFGYLYWLLGVPILMNSGAPISALNASPDLLLMLSGALIIAIAGRFASRFALLAAWAASAGLIALLKPGFTVIAG